MLLVVTCWERADLFALVCEVCVFVTFPCVILGQVWCLIVMVSDLCRFSYLSLDLIMAILFIIFNLLSNFRMAGKGLTPWLSYM